MQQNSNMSKCLIPGDVVRVRPWPEIVSTLDTDGKLDGLPFMPEMLAYCGHCFTVTKRLERTCEENAGGMRRIRNAVFLGSMRCSGSAHDECQKACRIFWKEEWLQKIDSSYKTLDGVDVSVEKHYPYVFRLENGQYICQSTELIGATSRLPIYDLGVFLRDIRARTYTPSRLARILIYAVYLRFRRLVTGRSYQVLEGQRSKTPSESLNLHPGEIVRVKSSKEIASTLDSHGKNRGLAFSVEMLPFCNRTFRVLKRLERTIHEPTRKLIHLDNTVILEDVICDGCHILRGGCPRETYHFWREIWLERAALSSQSDSKREC
jgi:hypothetical protein